MTVYRFSDVGLIHRAKGACPGCGKTVWRQRRFSQTLNPFNRNADGTVKTERDIMVELRAEAAEWVPDFTHEKCREQVVAS